MMSIVAAGGSLVPTIVSNRLHGIHDGRAHQCCVFHHIVVPIVHPRVISVYGRESKDTTGT